MVADNVHELVEPPLPAGALVLGAGRQVRPGRLAGGQRGLERGAAGFVEVDLPPGTAVAVLLAEDHGALLKRGERVLVALVVSAPAVCAFDQCVHVLPQLFRGHRLRRLERLRVDLVAARVRVFVELHQRPLNDALLLRVGLRRRLPRALFGLARFLFAALFFLGLLLTFFLVHQRIRGWGGHLDLAEHCLRLVEQAKGVGPREPELLSQVLHRVVGADQPASPVALAQVSKRDVRVGEQRQRRVQPFHRLVRGQKVEGFGLHHERLESFQAIDELVHVVVNHRGHGRIPPFRYALSTNEQCIRYDSPPTRPPQTQTHVRITLNSQQL